jgi:uncharacterized paraquat-inducible protein A
MCEPPESGFLPLTHCPDCGLRRRPDELAGCSRCGLSDDAFDAITKLQAMYRAACVELLVANRTGIAQIIAITPREFL